MGFIEITTRVVPATREALQRFPVLDLRDYARALSLQPQGLRKAAVIDLILATGKATLCASLGT